MMNIKLDIDLTHDEAHEILSALGYTNFRTNAKQEVNGPGWGLAGDATICTSPDGEAVCMSSVVNRLFKQKVKALLLA